MHHVIVRVVFRLGPLDLFQTKLHRRWHTPRHHAVSDWDYINGCAFAEPLQFADEPVSLPMVKCPIEQGREIGEGCCGPLLILAQKATKPVHSQARHEASPVLRGTVRVPWLGGEVNTL